jgi:hypothetical protein
MPLLLPNLDDRTWADLTDESRALIPVYGPEWTDHNASDPGMTLVELLAWKAEMVIYRLNQVSDAEKLRFLNLVGIYPKAPRPAYTALSFRVTSGTPLLPKSLEFSGLDANQVETRYETLRDLTLAPGCLTAIQTSGTGSVQNLTPAWKRRTSLLPFGNDPQVGAAFYLGLSDALPVNSPVSFYFTFGDGLSSWKNREEILKAMHGGDEGCSCQLPNPCECDCDSNGKKREHKTKSSAEVLAHYGVRIVWEYSTDSGGTTQWVPLQPGPQVVDETRAFTLDGTVTVSVPAAMSAVRLGSVATPLFYLRCRIVAGRHDAAPMMADVAFNAVPAVQKVPAVSTFAISPNCAITFGANGAPKPMDKSAVKLKFDGKGCVIELDFSGDTARDPEFTVVDFQAPAGKNAGSLALELAFLGYGTGLPAQVAALADAPVERESVQIYTLEEKGWLRWHLREDFFATRRTDLHAVLDAQTGVVKFGDGEHGRVPPCHGKKDGTESVQCLIIARYSSTRAQLGKLGATTIRTLVDSPYNRALLSNRGANPNGWDALKAQLSCICNPLACTNGAAAETLNRAAGRADQIVETSGRAVTLADYEQLALSTPGTRIARVTAIANMHPDFPCFKAPGMISVIILPYLSQGRPMPTSGLLQTVAAYLRSRRIVGTRVEVVGPTYLEVAVQATIRSKAGADKAALQQSAIEALNAFLDPLTGGPSKTGWPFGRAIYRAEILRILNEVSYVDYVSSLALIPGEGPAQCGNICMGQTWLVAPGSHQIQVL